MYFIVLLNSIWKYVFVASYEVFIFFNWRFEKLSRTDYDKEIDTPSSRLVIWCGKRRFGNEIGMFCNISRGVRERREKGSFS